MKRKITRCMKQKKKSSRRKKEVLIKANSEMKSTIETKENVIMTKWKDVLLRETTKIAMHANLNGF